jgi:hydrogenase maturation factor
MSTSFPPGKLPLGVLDRLLHTYTSSDERILVGPQVGEDATVIEFGDTCLVVKSDPITFATDDIGYYAVHVNANDIATMGAEPRWFLATLLLPEKATDEDLVESIFDSIYRAAAEIGVSVCGGHTEITVGLDRPIVAGQMLGEVKKDRLIQSSRLGIGDALLLTKGLGIEATAILAKEKALELEKAGIGKDVLDRAANYLYDPGISILKEARIACRTGRIHAMHDPTEGGVATALRELAMAASGGLSLRSDALFAAEETQLLCRQFNLDPLGVISSGALLIGVEAEDSEKVRNAIRAAGIPCEIIGKVEEEAFGLKIFDSGTWQELPAFDRDEIGRIFE